MTDKQQPSSKKLFVVLDETGEPEYVASWPLACHEHINDAINEHKLDEARKWVVREVVVITAPETEGRAALCHGKAHIPITTCATCGDFLGSVADLRPEETAARIPPREFDIESHTGLYTELPLPVKAKGAE